MELCPVRDCDSRDKLRSTFTIRAKHQDFSIFNRTPLRKCERKIRHLRHDQRVATRRDVGDSLTEPDGSRLPEGTYALTSIAKFIGSRHRRGQSHEFRRLARAVRRACQNLRDGDGKRSQRLPDGRCTIATLGIELPFE
jgi:hypothetical protein